MRSRQLDRLVTEVLRRIGEASSSGGASVLPVLSVNNDNNTVSLDLGNGQTLDGVSAQAGYIPQVGHYATIIRNGMDLIVQPPQGAMTSPAPAATTGLVVTPGIQALVCSWDEAPEANVKNNRGFYQTQSADDQAMTENVASHIQAATKAVLTPVTAARWVQVRAINEAGVPGPYCDPVQGTPAAVPTPDASSITAALIGAATSSALALADGALNVLVLNSDGTIGLNDTTVGEVDAGQVKAGAIGTVALAADAVTAAKADIADLVAAFVGVNQLTAANIDVTDLVASIVNTNALYGKLLVGVEIQTDSSSGDYVLLGPGQYSGAIRFVSGGTVSSIDSVANTLRFFPANTPSGAQVLAIFGGSSPWVSTNYELNAGSLTVGSSRQPVWSQNNLYTVQVAFYTDGTNRFFSLSYSCPFTPSKVVATSNTAGMLVTSAGVDSGQNLSLTSSGCTIQVSDATGGISAYGLCYVTLMLS